MKDPLYRCVRVCGLRVTCGAVYVYVCSCMSVYVYVYVCLRVCMCTYVRVSCGVVVVVT